MQLNSLVLSYVASAAVATGVSIAAWRRRPMPGARELAFLMLAVGWWLVANAFEAAATDRTTKIAWSVIAYPGIVSTPVLYLLFALRWTHQDGRVTRSRIAMLFVVPVASVVLAATNEWHHLLWPSVTLIEAFGVTAVYDHGPWFWIELIYAYMLVGAGLAAIGLALYRHPAVYPARIRVAIVGSFAPIVASVAYAVGLDASIHADLSSIAFAFSGLIAAFGILRLSVLDPVPVAWARLVDMLADAVLVIAPGTRLAALNPSASRLLGVARDSVGRPIEDVLAGFPEILPVCMETHDVEIEVCVGDRSRFEATTGSAVDPAPDDSARADSATADSPDGRWFNVRVTMIRDVRGRDMGRLVVLREVTERRRMVETIRQLSLTDELTGLLNRRGFLTIAERQVRTSARTRNRLWLLFADVDGLKAINDRLGHEAGDSALREIAGLLRTSTFRDADIVGRLGGDEFAVLATEIGRIDGEALVERLEGAVRTANERPDRTYELSVSVGATVFEPANPQTLDDLLVEADRRMYLTKRSRREDTTGRDRAVASGSP